MNEKECDVRFMNFEFDWQLVYLLLAFSNKFLSDRYVLTAKNMTNCYKHNYFYNISQEKNPLLHRALLQETHKVAMLRKVRKTKCT